MNIFKKNRIMRYQSISLKDLEESLMGKTTKTEIIAMLDEMRKERGITMEEIQENPSLGYDLYIDVIKAKVKESLMKEPSSKSKECTKMCCDVNDAKTYEFYYKSDTSGKQVILSDVKIIMKCSLAEAFSKIAREYEEEGRLVLPEGKTQDECLNDGTIPNILDEILDKAKKTL